MEEKLNVKFFACLSNDNPELVIKKCMQLGLISTMYVCPVCGMNMSLRSRPQKIDMFDWICRTRSAPSHCVQRSVRAGSYFERSKMSIPDILLLTHFLLHRVGHKVISGELDITSHTVCDWHAFMREVCVEVCLKMNEPIGGPGQIVEINESKLAKRKFNRGRSVDGKWVFGGVERGSTRCFFKAVERRDKETLLDIIKTFILPGTTIYSDCWESYDCLVDKEFRVLADNRSLRYKDSETKVHTNSVVNTSTWTTIKRSLSGRCAKDQFDSYLAEYIWRRTHGDTGNLTRAFLKAAADVHFPRTCDIGPEVEIEEEEPA